MRKFTSTSELQTIEFAAEFGRGLRRGNVVALFGDLGSGKTQFVKGVCRAFGVNELVASPTFVLLNRYGGRDSSGEELLIYHFDLYRIQSLDEIYDLGYEEFIRSNGICLIEWANVLGTLLPATRYEVHLAFGDNDEERVISIKTLRGNETIGGGASRSASMRA
ncbi:MAG TPA: tRNA (adenosine(37)-N6)-threonylcarbamoyltransferase complex ATPase subunit type 1 TsaE [Bacteroidota bacterium]|nr:tRNA (adenosine(37)-N6)-threonylcarbamoyltransferase complex ATPase subunit type 1 TsaE [Bacteroidota bacterium]